MAPTVIIGLRFALSAIFLFAGLAKLPRRAEFEQVVRLYELVPARAARAISIWLPILEVVGGLGLLLGVATVFVAALLACLIAIFAGAITINLVRGRQISCGCHMIGAPSEITWMTVGRNAVLIATALLVALTSPAGFDLLPVLRVSDERIAFNSAFAALIASTLVVLSFGIAMEAFRLRRHLASVRAKAAAA
jgi:uncharacterized membrane protein YphA (DoxX/SURF4 family)